MSASQAAKVIKATLRQVGPWILLSIGAAGVAIDGCATVPRGCSLIAALAMFGVSAILHWDLLDRLSSEERGHPASFVQIALAATLSLVTASLAAVLIAKAA